MYELRIRDLVENTGFEPVSFRESGVAFLIKLILLISSNESLPL